MKFDIVRRVCSVVVVCRNNVFRSLFVLLLRMCWLLRLFISSVNLLKFMDCELLMFIVVKSLWVICIDVAFRSLIICYVVTNFENLILLLLLVLSVLKSLWSCVCLCLLSVFFMSLCCLSIYVVVCVLSSRCRNDA